MSTHTITWSHGRAEILTTAGMLARCTFIIGDREFSPFAHASWTPEDVPDLPGHLRVLGAEFVCLPFGEGGPATRLAGGWGSIEFAEPNVPGHGHAADAEWEVVDQRTGGITLRLDYPEGNGISSLERRIDGIPGVSGLTLSLTINARRPTLTSVGVHPILRLPATPRSLAIDARFSFGLTYPADLVVGKTRAERGAVFSNLAAVPLATVAVDELLGEHTDDFSRLPFEEPTEEVVQLCGVSRPIVVHYLDEDASLSIDWDRRLLPSAQLWISDQALPGPPWNGTYRGLGIEPIASAFDLANDISLQENPISARGVPTSVEVSPSNPLSLEYRIIATSCIK